MIGTDIDVDIPASINPASAALIYNWDMNGVITVPADGLAPKGASASPGTMLISKSDKFYSLMNSEYVRWSL